MNADEGRALAGFYADQAADEAAEAAASAEAEALAEQQAMEEAEAAQEANEHAGRLLVEAVLGNASPLDDIGCMLCGYTGTDEDVDAGPCPHCGENAGLEEIDFLREMMETEAEGFSIEYLLEHTDEDATAVCIFCAWAGQYDELPPRTDDQAGDTCPECGEAGGITDVEELRAKYAQEAAEEAEKEADAPEDLVPLPEVRLGIEAYIIRKACGCAVAVVIDTPQIERKNMGDILKFFIRSDLKVDRASAREARRQLTGCICAVQTKMEM